MLKLVNFSVLLKAQGLNLTSTQAEETLISTSRALQVAVKCMMLDSIFCSQTIIAEKWAKVSKSTVSLPEIAILGNKSVQALRNLQISQVQWLKNLYTLSFTLNDVQIGKAGKDNLTESHTFDPAKKITRVQCIIGKDEYAIIQINFYHKYERLVTVLGSDTDVWVVKLDGGAGRREVFEIGDDEQLIGCRLYHVKEYFRGLTWLKMKVRF